MVEKTKEVKPQVTEARNKGALVPPAQGGPVASFVADMEKDSALGRAQMGIEDIALPYIAILQPLSPQVTKSNPARIVGAEEGMFYNTLSQELYDGEEGIYVVPCAYQKAWVEWKQRTTGGGFVASHPSGDILSRTSKDDKNFDVLPNGNVVVPTSYYYCLLLEDGEAHPVVISMARTASKKARRWNSTMLGIQVVGSSGSFNPPMFSHIYKLKTIPETKNNNSWFSWDIHLYQQISDPHLYQRARQMSIDVSKGLVKAAPPMETAPTDDDEPF